jgi:hypothetical protein
MSFVCGTCGELYDGDVLSFAADYPDPYADLSSEDRENRAVIGGDQCIIDGEEFYLRTLLEIPIRDSHDKFLFGLWVRLHEDVYDEIDACWVEEGKERKHGPFKGRIANKNLIYDDALNLKVTVVLQPVGVRPLIFVDESEHPLAVAQREGISLDGAHNIASRLLHYR